MVFFQPGGDLGSTVKRGRGLPPPTPGWRGRTSWSRTGWAQRALVRMVHEFICVHVCL